MDFDKSVRLGGRDPCVRYSCSCVCFVGFILVIVALCGFHDLTENEQLLVQGRTDSYVLNGPGRVYVSPYEGASVKKRKAVVLDADKYIILENKMTGRKSVEGGPGRFFLGPHESYDDKEEAVLLSANNYMQVTDESSGETFTIVGPQLYVPEGAFEVLGEVLDMHVVTANQYAIIINRNPAQEIAPRIVRGAVTLAPAPFETIEVHDAVTLAANDYLHVTDELSGVTRTERGPQLYFPTGTFELIGEVHQMIVATTSQYAIIINRNPAEEIEPHIVIGPATIAPEPFEEVEVFDAVLLEADEFIHVTDGESGTTYTEQGPQLYSPDTPFKVLGPKREIVMVSSAQYAVVVNTVGGGEGDGEGAGTHQRIVPGPVTLVPAPFEEIVVHEAEVVTAETALVVKSLDTGDLRLVEEPGMFIPTEFDRVIEHRHRELVAAYESAVISNEDGTMTFIHGTDASTGQQGTAFMLPALSEVIEFRWTRGGNVENCLENELQIEEEDTIEWDMGQDDDQGHADAMETACYLTIQRIDTRQTQLDFSFDDVRTMDNVEYELEGKVLYQIVDVEKLVSTTADPTGDIWHRIRSRITEVSTQYTFTEYLNSQASIVEAVMRSESNSTFYSTRGIELQSLLLIEVEFADQELEQELVDTITQEVTMRQQRLDQQLTENLVEQARIEGTYSNNRIEAENAQNLADLLAQNALVQAANEAELRTAQAEHDAQLLLDQISYEIEAEARRLELAEAVGATAQVNARHDGTAAGLRIGSEVEEFMRVTNESLGDAQAETGVELYKMHQEIDSRATTTEHLGSGETTLVVTQEGMNVNLGSFTGMGP